MKRLLVALALLVPTTGAAQDMASAPGGTLRFLDKVTGRVEDLSLSRGQAVLLGRLTVQLDECRYPRDNPAADAQAHLTVMETEGARQMFSGWMLASSPALSAMDHPRYDVWVLSCDSGFVAPEVTEPDNEEPLEEINEG
ncbi:DUF2155 domain-containing protein [Rhodobacter sp. ETT8]|uniref:DUF2155 domain-containing protein n=2 Tax=Pseudotabrizicola algicola TaxID=2709381 RepID=A0A6B3RF81_9RHOB|nr:DUF2155 domain-containing protein [Pseudotabrizicola algicola]